MSNEDQKPVEAEITQQPANAEQQPEKQEQGEGDAAKEADDKNTQSDKGE